MKVAILRILVLLMTLMIVGSCSKPTISLPSIHEMGENTYTIYDETVLSGRQVDLTLSRYKSKITILVVKNNKYYVFGDSNGSIQVAGNEKLSELESEKIIDRNRSYKSLVLRDFNNKVIGIKLTESNQ